MKITNRTNIPVDICVDIFTCNITDDLVIVSAGNFVRIRIITSCACIA